MNQKVKFKDLYDLYPNKWVVTIDSEWENGRIVGAGIYGVYDTEKEALESSKNLESCGIFKMVKEEDDIGFIFIITD
jgi:hypothetical protein